MPIKNRNLKPGAKLVARHRGKEHSAEVVKTKDGLRYRTADGQEFKSPSSAGSHVMGGIACNGWRFWSIEGQEPRKDGLTKEELKSNGLLERMEDGRWFCSACMDAFETEGDLDEPQTCPNGHTAEAVAEN